MAFIRGAIGKILEQLHDQGFNVEEILHTANISSIDLHHPHTKVQSDEFNTIIECIAQYVRDERIGFKLGFTTPISILGTLGILYQSADNLRQMQEYAVKYIGYVDQLCHYSFEVKNNEAFLRWHADAVWDKLYPLAMRQLVEHNFGFTLRCKREFLGRELKPLQISTPYSRIGGTDLIEQYFDCPVQFNKPYAQIVYSAEALEWKVLQSNRFIASSVEQYLQTLASTDEPSISTQIKSIISQQMGRYTPSLASVAWEMACSPRSLQRKLQKESTNFQRLLDEVRFQILKTHHNDMPLLPPREVARRIGFSNEHSLHQFMSRMNRKHTN